MHVFQNRRVASVLVIVLSMMMGLTGCPLLGIFFPPTEDIAREWNELLLDAIRVDTPRPPVHSRNLFHLSAVMYEAWSAYDETATGYFTGYRYKQPASEHNLANRAEAISHAAYGLLTHRFSHLGEAEEGTPQRAAFDAFTNKMRLHGYLTRNNNPVPSDAQRLGARIAEIAIKYGFMDGSNEQNNYADTTGYTPMNPPLLVAESGTNGIEFPGFWQELIVPNGNQQRFLTPHWGRVKSFALPPFNPDAPIFDFPGPPVWMGSPEDTQWFIDEFMAVLTVSASLDPNVGLGAEMRDVSPGVRFNNSLGTNDGTGHPYNPFTMEPYAPNVVLVGDWERANADYWADGPSTETPPGHWNAIANDILTGQGVVSQRALNKANRFDLEYDIKLYFTLNAAAYDSAIATWDVKASYDFVRPISAIRYLAESGQLPETPGLVAVIEEGDPLAGEGNEFVGQNKIFAWRGHNQGVDWMRGADWRPYQFLNFVTPPFPGYTSGHSGFSSSAAEVLTRFTGDPFFPGGLGKYEIESLYTEEGPSQPVTLQWATYYDAADQAGISRMGGGIHPPVDDFPARVLGSIVGQRAYDKAQDYFNGRGVAVAKSLTD